MAANNLPIVMVKWWDADINISHEAHLDDPKDLEKFGWKLENCLCQDVGFLVRKNKQVVVLAVGMIMEDDIIRHSITIPAGMVKEIVYLEPRQEPKPYGIGPVS